MVQLAKAHAAIPDVKVGSVQMHVVFVEEQTEDGRRLARHSLC